MKLRSPWLIKLVAFLGALTVRSWMATVRYRFANLDSAEHPADVRGQRYIYAFWHETMLFPAVVPIKIQILISQHADGELIAQICRYLDKGAARGSSTRGGSRGLLEMIRFSRHFHLAITPDGPRGPRRRLQPGAILLASASGLPIIPLGIGFSKVWRLRSWDRFAVPWPGSTATCVIAPSVRVPPDLKRDGLEYYRRLVEDQMRKATDAAEAWATGGPRPTLHHLEKEAG